MNALRQHTLVSAATILASHQFHPPFIMSSSGVVVPSSDVILARDGTIRVAPLIKRILSPHKAQLKGDASALRYLFYRARQVDMTAGLSVVVLLTPLVCPHVCRRLDAMVTALDTSLARTDREETWTLEDEKEVFKKLNIASPRIDCISFSSLWTYQPNPSMSWTLWIMMTTKISWITGTASHDTLRILQNLRSNRLILIGRFLL